MDGLNEVERAVVDAVQRAGLDGTLASGLRNTLVATYDGRAVTEALRALMTSGKIVVTRSSTGTDHLVTLKKAAMSENFVIVLSVVRNARSTGIDADAIASKMKIAKSEVTKALNAYVQQGAIKETRCFINKARKLYMLAELEPSAEVTGGIFYTESRDLDHGFVDSVRGCIVAFVTSRQVARVSQLKQALDADGSLGARRLSIKEVGTVARTLELDGVLRKVAQGGGAASRSGNAAVGDVTYGVTPATQGTAADAAALSWAVEFPCTGCPMLASCSIARTGVINPTACAYLNDWLQPPDAGATDVAIKCEGNP
jgi:DNA-directed RNA polymerase III subunit RPC6